VIEEMVRKGHWEGVYATKSADAVSWYAPHLVRSLAMIQAVADPSSEIIDVGGGASTLVDELLNLGYSRISVLDVANASLEIARRRLGGRADAVTWITADVTDARLPAERYDVWHDRAVFHFLTEPADRNTYTEIASRSIKPAGHLILATFSLQGPTRCSGLDVVRYNAETLGQEIGPGFLLEQEVCESHVTPAGNEQRFVHCCFRRSRVTDPDGH
jgi:2-polyprenyl-3-methyl-5-hydroxy-6-metoxy-1,4-benzoquinol methylase